MLAPIFPNPIIAMSIFPFSSPSYVVPRERGGLPSSAILHAIVSEGCCPVHAFLPPRRDGKRYRSHRYPSPRRKMSVSRLSLLITRFQLNRVNHRSEMR